MRLMETSGADSNNMSHPSSALLSNQVQTTASAVSAFHTGESAKKANQPVVTH